MSQSQLEIIGKAANHFSDELFKRHETIEWAKIVGLRNLPGHEYFGIDLRIVWQIIQNNLPRLKKNIKLILKITLSIHNFYIQKTIFFSSERNN